MKISHSILFVMLLTAFLNALGQEETVTVKSMSINDVYIQTGFFMEPSSNIDLDDFRALAPRSKLLENDLSDFSSPYDYYMMDGNMTFTVLLGFQFIDKEKKVYKANPLLRVGFSYSSGTYFAETIFKEDRKPYDTLVSTQTGETFYRDSVTDQYYNMYYQAEQLRLNCSLIYRTNPAARWSFYGGVGLSAGVSMNAYTTIYYDRSSFIDASSYSSSNSGYGDYAQERFENKNNFGFSAFVPLGVDYRIGKKSEFLRMMHLFYELNPAINVTSIPELRTYTNAVFLQAFGLRISWN